MNDATHRGALGLIAAGMAFGGAAKLANVEATTVNFAKWGYPDPAKYVIGAIELGIAGSALAEIRSRGARPVAGVGTLCAMACALATQIRSGDNAPNSAPPLALTAAAVVVLRTD